MSDPKKVAEETEIIQFYVFLKTFMVWWERPTDEKMHPNKQKQTNE